MNEEHADLINGQTVLPNMQKMKDIVTCLVRELT